MRKCGAKVCRWSEGGWGEENEKEEGEGSLLVGDKGLDKGQTWRQKWLRWPPSWRKRSKKVTKIVVSFVKTSSFFPLWSSLFTFSCSRSCPNLTVLCCSQTSFFVYDRQKVSFLFREKVFLRVPKLLIHFQFRYYVFIFTHFPSIRNVRILILSSFREYKKHSKHLQKEKMQKHCNL